MSSQSSQQASRSSASGAAPPAAALPDINAETYPFDTVMYLLDQAAYLTLFSIPAKGRPEVILSRGGFSRWSGEASIPPDPWAPDCRHQE